MLPLALMVTLPFASHLILYLLPSSAFGLFPNVGPTWLSMRNMGTRHCGEGVEGALWFEPNFNEKQNVVLYSDYFSLMASVGASETSTTLIRN